MPDDFDPSEMPFDEAIGQFRQHGFSFIQQHGIIEIPPPHTNSQIFFVNDEFLDLVHKR